MVFKEEQYLRKIWLLPLITGLALLVGLLMMVEDFSGEAGEHSIMALTIAMVVMGMVIWLLITMKLETRIDDRGISFKSPPFISDWKKHPWETILQIEPISTRAIWGTGGIGIRYSLRGEWRYLFSVRHAVRIHLKNKSFVLSTRKPEEFMTAWENWKLVS